MHLHLKTEDQNVFIYYCPCRFFIWDAYIRSMVPCFGIKLCLK